MKDVIEFIKKIKTVEEKDADTFDYSQFILPASEEHPCLVIMPYSASVYYKDMNKRKGRDELIKELIEENTKKIKELKDGK